jgi:hypothetical protein
MILDDVLKLIDRLTPEQKQQVKQYIDQQTDALRDEIDLILSTVHPILLKAGTMDIDQLLHAAQDMWDGLDEPEIDATIQAMNEEYIEPVRASDE